MTPSTPKQDEYIKQLMLTLKTLALPYRSGYIELCEFMYHAEVPQEHAKIYLRNYARKTTNSQPIQ